MNKLILLLICLIALSLSIRGEDVDVDNMRVLKKKNKCKKTNKYNKKKCDNKQVKCNLIWIGNTCSKNSKDGGCQKAGSCTQYTCKVNCKKNSGCNWKNGKCKGNGIVVTNMPTSAPTGTGPTAPTIPPTYKDAVMLFPSVSMQAANKGIEGLDLACELQKPTQNSPKNKYYYCDGDAVAFMCSEDQDISDTIKKIGGNMDSHIYGTKDVYMGKFSNMANADNLMDPTAYEAGIRTTKGNGPGNPTNKFWSGCNNEGTNSGSTCNNWSQVAKGVKGTVGSIKGVDSNAFKQHALTPCNAKRQLLCLCNRAMTIEVTNAGR